jgi:hypothetical protein
MRTKNKHSKHVPVEITTPVTLYQVLTDAHDQLTEEEIIADNIKSCCDLTDPKMSFETKLIEALQKFKEENQ